MSDPHVKRPTPADAETVEESLTRLNTASAGFTEPELLRPSRWMRLGGLVLPGFLIVTGVMILTSQQSDDMTSWALRLFAAASIAAGFAGWLALARGRVLLAPEGLKVRRIFRERTIPWKELCAIDLHCEHSWEDGDQHSLEVKTESGESIRLPGFRTMVWMGGKQAPPSMRVAAERIAAWRSRYDPTCDARTAAPAGWYPDSANAGRLRYWQGASWTDHFTDDVPTAHPGLRAHEDASAQRN